MTDSMKLAEMQRTSIEYERQRHLANWFIKSSPHMATPSTPTTLTSNGPGVVGGTHLHVEGRKPKLRRFNSHDTSANMFSVTDFENARLARRNEIEMKQHLQRRMRNNANGNNVHNLLGGGCDFSTGDSKSSKYSNESQHEPLPADIFLNRYSLPRVVRITYKTKFSDETLQSSSSNDSSTSHSASTHSGCGRVGVVIGTGKSNGTNTSTGTTETGTSCSTASSAALNSPSNQLRTTSNNNNNNNNSKHVINSNLNVSTTHNNNGKQDETQENGELFLLYRLIRQRHIYHGYNAKTAATNRKKCVLIPQEFSGYFSLLNEKGLPTATIYTSLIQLVRERVYKFVSVDNMPAFSESQSNGNATNNPQTDSCLPLYTTSSNSNNRPQYVKTTARCGQVFRLLAVFEDGKQDHHALGSGATNHNNANTNKINATHGREKEKGRYAQLLNENRQILYVSLSTKGKFYEIEPGIPQILQKLGGAGLGSEVNKKVNPDCVHRITMLVGINKELPITLRYISGPNGGNNIIPEYVSITKITTENVMIACPIEDVEAMQQPLQLRKLHLTKEMNLMKSSLGFESESRMLANPNVQNILKFCQFNCDQFLKMLEIEQHNRSERSGSKSRVDGLRILKPLHLPKLLRREKTMSAAHEREDSIIFFSKTDLANMNANKTNSNNNNNNSSSNNNAELAPSRITDKMKVFQTTKKKWFRKQDKNSGLSMTSLELDVQSKRLSMERYSDISKLLQERFGDKTVAKSAGHSYAVEHGGGGSMSGASVTSDLGCSDTETSTLPTVEEMKKTKQFPAQRSSDGLLQKSMSLQDIELMAGRQQNKCTKSDLLASHQHQKQRTADTISEAGTELEEQENCAPLPQSFITEKLYNEFHVKTRQYSKSSSSLHQLLNFSLPQKLQIHENNNQKSKASSGSAALKRLDFNIGAPVAILYNNVLSPISFIEDDLPYSSVRDSLLLPTNSTVPGVGGVQKQPASQLIDYTKENIYAEICHEASAMGGVPTSRNTFSNETQSTHLPEPVDDYGDYASLTYLNHQQASATTSSTSAANVVGNAVSRVQVNCLPSSVSYHTVYLGDEPLGASTHQDRSHITTVELKGVVVGGGGNSKQQQSSSSPSPLSSRTSACVARGKSGGLMDNIYNTLK